MQLRDPDRQSTFTGLDWFCSFPVVKFPLILHMTCSIYRTNLNNILIDKYIWGLDDTRNLQKVSVQQIKMISHYHVCVYSCNKDIQWAESCTCEESSGQETNVRTCAIL